jgi:hypothetical protein
MLMPRPKLEGLALKYGFPGDTSHKRTILASYVLGAETLEPHITFEGGFVTLRLVSEDTLIQVSFDDPAYPSWTALVDTDKVMPTLLTLFEDLWHTDGVSPDVLRGLGFEEDISHG